MIKKLSTEQIIEIKRLLFETNLSIKRIAKMFKVCEDTIYRVRDL